MRAVLLTEFGPPGVLVATDVPDPEPSAGQVVVRVAFANITFVETQVRAGRGPGPASRMPPFVPGNGVGGTVTAVGTGVDPDLVGRRVVTATGGVGGYAEAVAVPVTSLIDVPDGLDLEDAVALLADGRTAVALADAAALRPGERVLVEAAAGGVGSLLVQVARNAGATVVAAAGGADKLALATELGAAVAVDYREPCWTADVREAVGGLDVVFDGVGGTIGRAAFDLLDPGGRMFVYGLASGSFTRIDDEEARTRGVTVTKGLAVAPDRMPDLTRAALAEARQGRLRPVIGQWFALARAADAHATIESRATLGKTLLVVA
ncbi:MAG TPA: zinc-binding dehydrogenase [Pseudonocardiaceae bacterium]|nr:zinc-binding dehydrogenase [Pseudonocardiaceae bacterium]